MLIAMLCFSTSARAEESKEEVNTCCNSHDIHAKANPDHSKICIHNHETATKKCSNCSGKGKITCDNCGGSGKVACAGCKGNGYIQVGKEKRKCVICNGSATAQCKPCWGKGSKRCNKCDGAGQITIPD